MNNTAKSVIYWILFVVLGLQILNTPQVMIQRGMKDNTEALEDIANSLAILSAAELKRMNAPVAQVAERRVEATEAAVSKSAGSTKPSDGFPMGVSGGPRLGPRLDDIPLEEGNGKLLEAKP